MAIEYLTGEPREAKLRQLRERGLGGWNIAPDIPAEWLVLDAITARNQGRELLRPTVALRSAYAWADDGTRNLGLWLVGEYGCGKTLALAMLVGGWRWDANAWYASGNRRGASQPLFCCEDQLPGLMASSQRRYVEHAALLAIDEVAVRPLAERGDPRPAIALMLERRYNAGLPTIFSANPQAHEQPGSHPRVVDLYGGRLVDRWNDGAHPVVVWCPAERLRQDQELQGRLREYAKLARERLVGERETLSSDEIEARVVAFTGRREASA